MHIDYLVNYRWRLFEQHGDNVCGYFRKRITCKNIADRAEDAILFVLLGELSVQKVYRSMTEKFHWNAI